MKTYPETPVVQRKRRPIALTPKNVHLIKKNMAGQAVECGWDYDNSRYPVVAIICEIRLDGRLRHHDINGIGHDGYGRDFHLDLSPLQ